MLPEFVLSVHVTLLVRELEPHQMVDAVLEGGSVALLYKVRDDGVVSHKHLAQFLVILELLCVLLFNFPCNHVVR